MNIILGFGRLKKYTVFIININSGSRKLVKPGSRYLQVSKGSKKPLFYKYCLQSDIFWLAW